MGLLQKAVETYDAAAHLAGIPIEGKNTLTPISHLIQNAQIEITIDQNGEFITAKTVPKNETKTIIPVTEKSAGRSGTQTNKYPHALCDQLSYFIAAENENYFLIQLRKWTKSDFSHPMAEAVLRYAEKHTILRDLESCSVIQMGEDCLTEGKINGVNYEKCLIRWRIVGLDEKYKAACWEEPSLFSKYSDYYDNEHKNDEAMLCMISGQMERKAESHPKGVLTSEFGAKLISANDSSGLTYRGRFTEDWQAASIGYSASQKAHSALRWLIAEQGVYIGKRAFLCWDPQGKWQINPIAGLRRKEEEAKWSPSDYRQELKNTLFGFHQDSRLNGDEAMVLASFDAATNGRLAVTYYSEISADRFLQRMIDWDSTCCWYAGKRGIRAPSLLQIVDCAFGIQRNTELETDNKIKQQHVQRLLNCKMNGGIFPVDILKALTQRASMPLAYEEKIWRNIVSTACAALQKYHYDIKQGGDEMSWELDRKDRSFQYGRLLAAMEKAEADYYFKTKETRQTNAIKSIPEFRRRPWDVFERINRQLHQAYLPRIEQWQETRYERLVGEIISIIKEFPVADLNRPLDNIYLMGYELQRNAFFAKDNENKTEENKNG